MWLKQLISYISDTLQNIFYKNQIVCVFIGFFYCSYRHKILERHFYYKGL